MTALVEISTTSAQILFSKCYSLLKGTWFSLEKWFILDLEQRKNKVTMEYTRAHNYYFCIVHTGKIISNRK